MGFTSPLQFHNPHITCSLSPKTPQSLSLSNSLFSEKNADTTTTSNLNNQPDPQMTSSIESLHHVITDLLTTTLHVTTFPSRWHAIRSHLLSLSSSILPSISASPHHSSNHLLTQILLPNLDNTLTRVKNLSALCSDPLRPAPKLLMQSDLDMANGGLSKQIRDLDLLLRSGVLNHSTAIVLARPNADSGREEVVCFVRDLFVRLQIEGAEFKKKSLESLVLLLRDNEKAAGLVSEEGNVGYLIGLLDGGGGSGVMELAVNAVAVLACGGDGSRRKVFDEGGLGPLLRVVESGPVGSRERAAMAVEAVVQDADSVWALSAYGGVPTLMEASKVGSETLQAHAIGALRNAAVREDVRAMLVEEGAAPVLLHVLAAGNPTAQEKAADCIAVMAMSDDGVGFRGMVKREDGLVRLMDVLREDPGPDVMEHVLRVVYALSSDDCECCRVISSSAAFLTHVAEMVTHGNPLLQHISCLILSIMSLSDANKRAAAVCMPALLKLMESSKPDGISIAATTSLVSLLTVQSNRKDLVKDEKCLVRLVNMHDPRQDTVAKELAVTVMVSVLAGGSEGCRRRVVEAGGQQYLQKLAEMGVVGAKKVVQKLSRNRFKSLFSRTWRELPGK